MNKAFALMCILAILLVGCDDASGKVVDKKFIPSHTESSAIQRCNAGGGQGYRPGGPSCQMVIETKQVPDSWTLTIESCDENNKCQKRTVNVSKSVYDSYSTGSIYPKEEKDK